MHELLQPDRRARFEPLDRSLRYARCVGQIRLGHVLRDPLLNKASTDFREGLKRTIEWYRSTKYPRRSDSSLSTSAVPA